MREGAYYTPKRFADTWTGDPPAGTELVEFTILFANPPYATGSECQPASGTGALSVKEKQQASGSASCDADMDGCKVKGE